MVTFEGWKLKFWMATDPLAARATGAARLAAASAHSRKVASLRTPVLREGRGHGCRGRSWAGLLEDVTALGAGREEDGDDAGEEHSGGDHHTPEAEDVAELALDDGADGVHGA